MVTVKNSILQPIEGAEWVRNSRKFPGLFNVSGNSIDDPYSQGLYFFGLTGKLSQENHIHKVSKIISHCCLTSQMPEAVVTVEASKKL